MKFFEQLTFLFEQFQDSVEIAKKKGVRLGKKCRINGVKFGSEPYLITIGDSFRSANNLTFITNDESMHVLRNKYKELKEMEMIEPIKIGNNVFVGLNTVILPGSDIGENVIVGANSLIHGRLEPNCIYAGVPAKLICTLDTYKLKHADDFTFSKNWTDNEKQGYLIKHYFGNPL